MKANREQLICMAIGLVGGILSGLLGIGGAIFMIPAMTAFLPLSQHKVHGTSLAVVVPLAVVSGLIYGAHGHMDLRLAMVLVAGSIPGAVVGARLMVKVPARPLRRLFGLLLLGVGLRMLWG